jgi:hypothetical protein
MLVRAYKKTVRVESEKRRGKIFMLQGLAKG